MTRTRPCLLALALTANLALAAGPRADTAYACSCAASWSTEEALRRSDAVFAGEVVDIGKLTPPGNDSMTLQMPHLAPVTFDVKESWKGVSGESAVVHGQGPGASCGLNFERDETYLVFAYRTDEGENSPLQADYCGNTLPAGEATARNMLGPPPVTLPETGGVSPARTERWSSGTYAVAAVLATGVFFGWLATRGRAL